MRAAQPAAQAPKPVARWTDKASSMPSVITKPRLSFIGATTMGYGLGPASASAFNVKADKHSIAIMGDGGFWHNGLTSGVGNAVYNQHDGVILVVDNHYTSATGGQDILSSRADNKSRSTKHPITEAVKGGGTAGQTYETVKELKDVAQLDRLDDNRAVILVQAQGGPMSLQTIPLP